MADTYTVKAKVPPVILDASDPQVGPALKAAKGPVILNNAHDIGFLSDRVIIMPGDGHGGIDPDEAVRSNETPVLTRGMFLKAVRAVKEGPFDYKQGRGLLEPGNIDIDNRKVMRLPDGGYKTEQSMSFGTENGEVLIPTVIDGKEVTPKEAIAHYKKTGEHLGVFDSPDNANFFADRLHHRQQRKYKDVITGSAGSDELRGAGPGPVTKPVAPDPVWISPPLVWGEGTAPKPEAPSPYDAPKEPIPTRIRKPTLAEPASMAFQDPTRKKPLMLEGGFGRGTNRGGGSAVTRYTPPKSDRFVPSLKQMQQEAGATRNKLVELYKKHKDVINVDRPHFELWKRVTNEGADFARLENKWRGQQEAINAERMRLGKPKSGLTY